MKNLANLSPNRNLTETKHVWGLSAAIDLYDCDPEMIKDFKTIEKFVIDLCDLIDMKRFGEAMIERFADGYYEGVSLMQFIETSNVTAHFDEQENRAFIDIFSCKYFDAEVAARFCKEFFKADKYRLNTLERD
jgi:S-adenosylmethionine decarboxylase